MLVGMVRVGVNSWVKHYVFENPHRDKSTRMPVCVCVCVCVYGEEQCINRAHCVCVCVLTTFSHVGS